MSSEYFAFLRSRGRVGKFLRRLFLRPIVRYFSGRVLDIGAGIGEFLEQYPDAVGLDINADCVRYCVQKGLRCVQADVSTLPFANDSFDGVLLNNVLEHFEKPDEVFSEILRVLRDGGRLMIEVPGKKGFAYDRTHVRFWDREDLIQYLEARGFGEIQTSFFPVPLRLAGLFLTHNKLRLYARLRK